MKRCITCGKDKPLSEYHTQTYTGQPYNTCKVCYNIKRSLKKDTKKHNRFIVGMFERCGELADYQLEDWHEAMIYFNASCAYCGVPQRRGKSNRMTRDHIVPMTKGGKTSKENVVPCCGTCNRSKGNKALLEWYPTQTSYSSVRLRKVLQWMGGAPQ